MHLKEVGTTPQVLAQKDVEFRNSVTHRGKIPTRDEAIDFGEHVLTLLRSLIDTLKERFPDAVTKLVLENLMAQRGRAGANPTATASIGTIVSLISADRRSLRTPSHRCLLHGQKQMISNKKEAQASAAYAPKKNS